MRAETKVEVIERPFVGHFIGGHDCRFFRTTDVGGRWRISTVGDYHPTLLPGEERRRHEIGYKRFYETMVFELGTECCGECGAPCAGAPKVSEWSEKDFEGYMTASDADRGHAAMVAKYVEACR